MKRKPPEYKIPSPRKLAANLREVAEMVRQGKGDPLMLLDYYADHLELLPRWVERVEKAAVAIATDRKDDTYDATDLRCADAVLRAAFPEQVETDD